MKLSNMNYLRNKARGLGPGWTRREVSAPGPHSPRAIYCIEKSATFMDTQKDIDEKFSAS